MIRQLGFFVYVTLSCFVSVSSLFSQSKQVQITPESVKSRSFDVRKGSDKVLVESREFQVRVELPSHKAAMLHVSMLYDPGSKLFWWYIDSVAAATARQKLGIPVLFPHHGVIRLTESKFILFWNGEFSGDYIFVLESAEHYSSMDEGQVHLLHMLQGRLGDIDSGKPIHEFKRIEFPGLDKDFLFAKNSAFYVGPKLKDVKRIGHEWQITEDGPNGGSALIVLNDQYEVIKTTLLPSK